METQLLAASVDEEETQEKARKIGFFVLSAELRWLFSWAVL